MFNQQNKTNDVIKKLSKLKFNNSIQLHGITQKAYEINNYIYKTNQRALKSNMKYKETIH